MHSYDELFARVMDEGSVQYSRLGDMRELTGVDLYCPSFVLPARSGMRRELGYMELMQLIAGMYDEDSIKRVAPNVDMSLFSFQAAYGPRAYRYDQLEAAIQELRQPNSRRAVVMLAEGAEPLDQRPCTTSLQFLKRDAELMVVANMRSWDLWYGAPYDLMMFTGLCQMVATLTNVAPAGVIVQVGSAHVYEKHWPKRPDSQLYSFSLPTFEDLYEYQDWAAGRVVDASWRSGPPVQVREQILTDHPAVL